MADTEALVNQLNECAEKQDFEGAFRLVRENRAELDKKIRATGIRDALKKTTRGRRRQEIVFFFLFWTASALARARLTSRS